MKKKVTHIQTNTGVTSKSHAPMARKIHLGGPKPVRLMTKEEVTLTGQFTDKFVGQASAPGAYTRPFNG